MDDTAAQQRTADGGRHPMIYACGGVAAVCAAVAGALSSSDVNLAGSFGVAPALLSILTFLQFRQLIAETERLRIRFTDAERTAKTNRMAQIQMQNLLDSISDGCVLWDSQERPTLYNPQASIVGAPAVSAGITFNEYVSPIYPRPDEQTTGGDPRLWLETRRRWFESADGFHEVLLKSGIWMLISERRTQDSGTVTIYTNITESKRVEQLRDDSERRMAHAQKLARIDIFEWDAVASEMY